jgi:glycosyltransferase involved in cell wall biosynthesis
LVYGLIDPDAGSLATGHYLVLDELLRRGHQLELLTLRGYQRLGALVERENLRVIELDNPRFVALWRGAATMPPLISQAAQFALSQATFWAQGRELADLARARHHDSPFQAQLFMGVLPTWKLERVPMFAWTQGCPRGEFSWILEHIPELIEHGAAAMVPMLIPAYTYKELEAALALRRVDVLGCGSEWARELWARLGVTRDRIHAIPYPTDLSLFAPRPPPDDKVENEVSFLHLGRIVPRKRIDLLLRAFAEVIRVEERARLSIVGRFAYAESYASLLQDPALSRNVEYRPHVERTSVPKLIAGADCIIQPSENENFGSAVAEGLAMGKPAIVGPSNGTKDYISRSSIVFHDYSVDAIAASMLEMIARVRDRREAIAVEARETAERHFHVFRVTDSIERVLRAMIGAPT